MSENEKQPPAPSKQTSSVPLKKETVRVTLKAADAPPASPVATVPGAAPVRPPTPSEPPPPPVPTAPMVSGAPRPFAPAPTIALKPAGSGGGPAPTIRLATSTAPVGGARTIALKTATQPVGGTPTPSLPKATVQLQAPTQPLSAATMSASQMATLKMDEEEEEEGGGGMLKILSVFGFLAACVVLYFQYEISNTWINAEDSNPATKGDFMQLLEQEPNSSQPSS